MRLRHTPICDLTMPMFAVSMVLTSTRIAFGEATEHRRAAMSIAGPR